MPAACCDMKPPPGGCSCHHHPGRQSDPDEVVLVTGRMGGKTCLNAKPIVIHVKETLAAQQDVEIQNQECHAQAPA